MTNEFDVKIIENQNVKSKRNDILEHFKTLSSDDLYLRFFRTMNEYHLESWVDNVIDNNENHKLIFIYKGDKLISLGQLSISATIGELALSVNPDQRKYGLASKIFDHLISFAKDNTNLSSLYITFKHSNQAVVKLAKKYGFKLGFVDGECFGTLELLK